MRSPEITASPGSGCRPWSNASPPRARPRSSLGPDGRTQPAGGRAGSRGPDHPAPQTAVPAGPGRRRGDHRRAPGRRRGVADAGGLHDLADLVPPRVRDTAAAETAPVIVAAVLRRTAQRALAGRHHPLAARRGSGGGDLKHPRRPLPGLHRLDSPPHLHSAPRSGRSSSPRPAAGASRRRCSPIMVRSSPANSAARAESR